MIAVYCVAAFVVPPEMFSDSAYGFLVSDSMAHGGGFNRLVTPDFGDIAHDQSLFLAVWSPGQYMFPALLEQCGLGLGAAMNVVTTCFTILGLLGWYRFYRRWDFPASSAAIAVAITAGSRHLALPFGIYNGGEVLLFGSMPWFLLLLGRWSSLRALQAAGLVAAIAAVAFTKLSGIVLAYAALAAVVMEDLWPPGRIKWRRPLMAAAIAVVFATAFYFCWMSRGWTAVDGKGATAWASVVPRFFEGWSATVMGMVSLGDLAARLLRSPGREVLPSLDTVYLIGAVPALALLGWAAARLRRSHPAYLRFAGAAALLFVATMAAIYGKGGPLLMEDRFFRPLSMLLLIGVVHVVMTSGKPLRLPLAGLAAATMLYGVGSYFVRLQHNFHAPLGARGFHHGTLTADGLALMRQQLGGALDRPDMVGGTVVWVMMPEIALEAGQARVLVNAELEEELGTRIYRGRAARLLVFVDDKMIADGKAEIVLRSFVDYDRAKWVATRRGDATVFAQ